MINTSEILQTLQMIDHQKLDVRTITMGISLFSCVTDDESALCRRIYDLITRRAENLVKVGRDIESEFGVPIVNKRISVTPVALVTGAIKHPERVAMALDKAAAETGVDFIGGYSALVHKGMTEADRRLIESIPRGAREHEAGLLVGQRRLHARRHQHGRGAPDGRNREENSGKNRGFRRTRLREAGRVLQCRRGQSVHGGRVPRSGRRRLRGFRRRQRSRCGKGRA